MFVFSANISKLSSDHYSGEERGRRTVFCLVNSTPNNLITTYFRDTLQHSYHYPVLKPNIKTRSFQRIHYQQQGALKKMRNILDFVCKSTCLQWLHETASKGLKFKTIWTCLLSLVDSNQVWVYGVAWEVINNISIIHWLGPHSNCSPGVEAEKLGMNLCQLIHLPHLVPDWKMKWVNWMKHHITFILY